MTKYLNFLFLFLAALLTLGCSDDEPKNQEKEVSMFVSSETGVHEVLKKDGGSSYKCMLVRLDNESNDWEQLGFYNIEGFTYEEGHEYELRVKTTVDNLPTDFFYRKFSLVRIVKDTKVKEPEDSNGVGIKSETEIEYQESCPFYKYKVAHNFVVNDKGDIFKPDGWPLSSYKHTRIYLDNILDKADPNWVKFNKIPYQATYSYVFSPLSDKIKMVSNQYGGPLFKEVVPETEFEHITKTMKSGEELQYQLILVNIYKKGLQKLQFTITKQ